MYNLIGVHCGVIKGSMTEHAGTEAYLRFYVGGVPHVPKILVMGQSNCLLGGGKKTVGTPPPHFLIRRRIDTRRP
jgi:hypothetical protein